MPTARTFGPARPPTYALEGGLLFLREVARVTRRRELHAYRVRGRRTEDRRNHTHQSDEKTVLDKVSRSRAVASNRSRRGSQLLLQT